MPDSTKLDDARRQALDKIELWDSTSRWLFWIGAACEVGFGITFIILLDFSNHFDLVLFFAVLTVYTPVALFIFSLACKTDRNTERIIQALTLHETRTDGER